MTGNDLIAQLDTFVADEDATRTGNQLPHLASVSFYPLAREEQCLPADPARSPHWRDRSAPTPVIFVLCVTSNPSAHPLFVAHPLLVKILLQLSFLAPNKEIHQGEMDGGDKECGW
jgi:hypothetical protein